VNEQEDAQTADRVLSTTDDNLLLSTFRLGEAAFGIDAGLVQEVVLVGDITRVHHAPPHVIGIRNLRGRIVTVADLAVLLALGSVQDDPDNRLLIMEWQNEPIGFLVDAVTEAVSINTSEIMAPPTNLPEVQRRNLRGVYQDGSWLVGVLAPEALFRSENTGE